LQWPHQSRRPWLRRLRARRPALTRVWLPRHLLTATEISNGYAGQSHFVDRHFSSLHRASNLVGPLSSASLVRQDALSQILLQCFMRSATDTHVHRPTWKTLLAFSIIYFVWGSTFLAIRIGVHEI